MNMVLSHKWEDLGFKAPYHVIGFWSMPSTDDHGYDNAMKGRPEVCTGVCHVCGIGIVHHFILVDSVGVKFSVGGDCVQKTDNVKLISEMKKVRIY